MTCPFCTLGICAEPAHRQPVLLFDVRKSNPPVPREEPELSYAEIDRRIRDSDLLPYPSREDEVGLISNELRVVIGKPNNYPIPKIIHRFWSGGAMREGAFLNLCDCGRKATLAGWKCVLWYSSTFESIVDGKIIALPQRTLRQTQRTELTRLGYTVRAIEDLAWSESRLFSHTVTKELLGKFARWAAEGALARSWDGVKYFSDFSRLFYLYEMGGFHIDVDMALGDMNLSTQYFHNDPKGEVPLLGTLARDSTSKEIARTLRYLKKCRQKGSVSSSRYRRALSLLTNTAKNGAGMFNALIASRPKTTHGKLALEIYRDKLLAAEMLDTGMSVQSVLLCGPPMARTLEKLDVAERYSVPPYVLRLDQLTDESDVGAGLKKL